MKKILSLLIIAMLTLNLYACSNTDSTNNSTTRDTSTANAATPYTYEGVTFEIPTVWGEPEENDDSDNTYYFYPEGQNDKKHDTVPAMLMIDITDADYLTGMSQEEIESNFDEFNSGISDTTTITSNKIVSSFKYPCEYVTGTNTTSGESRNIAMYVFFYNKKLYNVMMSTRDDNKHDYSSNLTNVIPPRTTGVGRGFPTFRAGSSIIYRCSLNLVPLSAERETTSRSTVDRCGGIAATDRNFCLFRDTRSLTDSGSY